MRDAGFTLLEVLIALVILAMGAQAVLWVFAEQSAAIARAERLQYAVALAENTFDRVGRDWPLQPGSRIGESAEGLQWQLRIAPSTLGRQAGPTRLYSVALTVHDRGQSAALLELSTLRIGAVQP